jgi:serine/threonine-protein kinase
MDSLVGKTIDGYEVKAALGPGLNTYKAYDHNLSRWVLIKYVSGEPTVSSMGLPGSWADLRHRAEAVAALRHPNISIIYRFGLLEGGAYSVSEYVPGGSVADLMSPGRPVSWTQALQVTLPISKALVYVHGQGVVHGNIGPATILLARDDWPLLAFDLDMAAVRRSGPGDLELPRPRSEAGYPARPRVTGNPEQTPGNECDVRTDIYCLGIVLYVLLSGRAPAEGRSAIEAEMSGLSELPRLLTAIDPEISAILTPVIETALAQEPNDRYQSMEEFSVALDEANQQLGQRNGAYVQGASESERTIPQIAAHPQPGPNIMLSLTESGRTIFRGDQAELIVGRASRDPDVQKPAVDLTSLGGRFSGVSRRHARLTRKGGQWLVEDFGSVNGTYVNGTKLPPYIMIPVNKGDILRFGQIEMVCGLE